MATPAEHLHDAVVSYLASLGDNDFRALVAQARPPADTPGYTAGGIDPDAPTAHPLRTVTAADAREAVRRRYGRIQGEEVR